MKALFLIFSVCIFGFPASASAAVTNDFPKINAVLNLISQRDTNSALKLFGSLTNMTEQYEGLLLMKFDRLDEAFDRFRKHIVSEPENERFNAFVWCLRNLSDIKGNDSVTAFVREQANLYGFDAQMVTLLSGNFGMVPLELDQQEELIRKFSEDPKYKTLMRDVQFKIAVEHYEKGRIPQALKSYETLFKLNPETQMLSGYRLQYAHILNNAGRYAEVLEILDQIEKNDPAYPKANPALFTLTKATAVNGLNGPRASQKIFKEVTKLAPEGDAYRASAQVMLDYMEKVDPELAVESPKMRSRRHIYWFLLLQVFVLAALYVWVRRSRAAKAGMAVNG